MSSPQISSSITEKLRHLLPETDIFSPDEEGHEVFIPRWSQVWEASPGLVVCPASSQEVSTIIQFTISHSIPFAIKCGGHGQLGGSSIGSSGMLISLEKMKFIVVDEENKTARIGGGALLGEINKIVGAKGFGVVSGICNTVGIGGLLLHGGYGLLTGAYGLALDNLVEATVVLADGRIVSVSETENEDLFWGIRGAGAALGLVTEFVLKCYQQTEECFVGRLTGFEKEDLGVIARTIDRVLAGGNEKASLCLFFLGALPSKESDLVKQPAEAEQEVTIGTFFFYNGTEEDGMRFFEDILEVQQKRGKGVRKVGMKKLHECGSDSPAVSGTRKVVKGGNFMAPINVQFLKEIYDDLEGMVRRNGFETSYFLIEFHGMDKIIGINQRGTAFSNRGRFGNAMITPTWKTEDLDEEGKAWAGMMGAKVRNEFERARIEDGVDDVTKESVGEYINYDGVGEEAKSLFGVNYDKLMEVKRKYDPDNIFNRYLDLMAGQ